MWLQFKHSNFPGLIDKTTEVWEKNEIWKGKDFNMTWHLRGCNSYILQDRFQDRVHSLYWWCQWLRRCCTELHVFASSGLPPHLTGYCSGTECKRNETWWGKEAICLRTIGLETNLHLWESLESQRTREKHFTDPANENQIQASIITQRNNVMQERHKREVSSSLEMNEWPWDQHYGIQMAKERKHLLFPYVFWSSKGLNQF